ncbi:MAG: EAL domain-containing protein [Gammaproteobacteria bacterium]|nr:EAL domain-containing protein [Gammaproteobacteria bacterium]
MILRLLQSPVIRLSLALAMMTSGLLLVADLVGIFPNQRAVMLDARKTVSESIAIQTVAAVESGETDMLSEVMNSVTARDPSVKSMALRDKSGAIVTAAGDHDKFWTSKTGEASNETQVQVPVYNGENRWGTLELAFTPIGGDRSLNGLPRSFLVVLLFISCAGFAANFLLLRRALRELDPSAVIPPRVQAALDALAEGLVIIDSRERILLANQAFSRKVERPQSMLVGQTMATLNWQPYDDEEALPEVLPWSEVLRDNTVDTGVHLRMETATGTMLSFAVNAVPVTAGDGSVRGALTTFNDLTQVELAYRELSRANQKLESAKRDIARQNQELLVLATRDAMTGVLNRRALFEAFENLLVESVTGGIPLCCVMIDIDKFKSINDSYGHGVGDKVIKAVAAILNDTARATDIVGRYGGEEFCALLPGTDLKQGEVLAERIRVAVQDGVGGKANTPFQVTVSLGVSSTEFGAHEPMDLCNQADRALYVAKESGRNRVVPWSDVAEYLGSDTVTRAEKPAEPPAPAKAAPGESFPRESELAVRIEQLERALSESERQRARALMEHPHGGGTSVSSWALLQDRLEQSLMRTRRSSKHVAVVAIEIDAYRTVNSTLGMTSGEKMIDAVNERLAGNLREIDTISMPQDGDPGVVLTRLTNDEFVLVLADFDDKAMVPRVVERLGSVFRDPFDIDGSEIFVTPRLGVAVYPGDGKNATELVANANAALRFARQRSDRTTYHFYSSEMNEKAREQLRVENELRHAIEREEFVLHYQPRIDLASGAITGMEALLRWNHPAHGMIFPDKFVPMAERLGLITQIGEWVAGAACRQVDAWSANGFGELELAINVSPIQLRDDKFLHKLREKVAKYGVPAERIELEITESVVIDNIDVVLDLMRKLADEGFKLALDDFGTGYSSLGYLRRLPLHRLKIDRSFLRGLGQNMTDYAIVSSVIEMSHSLGMRVVAEGIENEEQWVALCELGCDEGQGYLWSRPVSVEDAVTLLEKNSDLRQKVRMIHASRAEQFESARRIAIKGVLNDAGPLDVETLMRDKIIRLN